MGNYDEYFVFHQTSATCKDCTKSIARTDSNTSGLRYHLKTHHVEIFKKLDSRKQQASVKKRKADETTPSISSSFGMWQPGGPKYEAVNRALALMVAVDSQALAIVDRPGFRNFMSVVAPAFKLKSRTSLRRTDIPDLYEEYSARVKKYLESAEFVSYTTDSWSSEDNKHSLLSLTAHWIHEDALVYRVLGVIPIRGRHSAENLSQLLSNCMLDYLGPDPRKKCHIVVRDAASVMIKTSKLCGLDSIDCFAHNLQLAIYGALKKISDENRPVISAFCIDRPKFPTFNSSDFLIMEKIIAALQPIHGATVMLQGRDVTISSDIEKYLPGSIHDMSK
ncbi:hypothetical protein QR680_009164 [Steinernema hermaphroditum]|uniref:BED-type domain-containing protein n=1 Tax=Steinernema hermaphroditum TaxID=289476 RepID=A0AA39M8D4_9BILA|nr:hypothetical protein QR680_009164 [Steinernema hermaphroditum]